MWIRIQGANMYEDPAGSMDPDPGERCPLKNYYHFVISGAIFFTT